MLSEGCSDQSVHRERHDLVGIELGEEVLQYKDPHVLPGLRNSNAGQPDPLQDLPDVPLEEAISGGAGDGPPPQIHTRATLSVSADASAHHAFLPLQGKIQEADVGCAHCQEDLRICRVLLEHEQGR